MKPVPTLFISAAAILWSLAPAYSAPKGRVDSSSLPAEATLQQIDRLSSGLAEQAYDLEMFAQQNRDAESHLEGLDLMKDDINQIGKDLSHLESERASLAPWEAKAVDQIFPLMSDAASKAQSAIETYDSGRQHLWATSYPADTESVSSDAGKVASILHDYLKLKQARESETRIEQDLGEAPEF